MRPPTLLEVRPVVGRRASAMGWSPTLRMPVAVCAVQKYVNKSKIGPGRDEETILWYRDANIL